jgi:hypothetical protein
VTFALLPKKFDGFCLDGHLLLLLLILISTSLSYFGLQSLGSSCETSHK